MDIHAYIDKKAVIDEFDGDELIDMIFETIVSTIQFHLDVAMINNALPSFHLKHHAILTKESRRNIGCLTIIDKE